MLFTAGVYVEEKESVKKRTSAGHVIFKSPLEMLFSAINYHNHVIPT
jgi:hypothetical protein